MRKYLEERGLRPHRRVCVMSHGNHHEANGSSGSQGSSISTGLGIAPRLPTRNAKACKMIEQVFNDEKKDQLPTSRKL